MTEECITPLRRRMIEDMSVRHFASKTQHPRRNGLKRAASETRRQKVSRAVRAPAAPPFV